MKIVILSIQTSKEAWAEDAQALYFEKLKHFFKFEMVSLKSPSSGRESSEEKKRLEAEKINSFLDSSDFVILLDERGKTFSSEKFAVEWQKIIESGKSRVVLIIGGAFGVSEEVRKRSHLTVRLSDMVMNHHLAKIVLMEQIYRAMTLIKGIPYHNK